MGFKMFCSECGSKFHESVKFCWNCGKAVLNIDSVNSKTTESKDFKNITHSSNVEGAGITLSNTDVPSEIHPTPKGVDEQLQHAGFWIRVCAFYTDFLLFFFAICFWFEFTKGKNLSIGLSNNQFLLFLGVLFFLYDTISNYKYGGTFAKRWMGLRVRRLNKLDNLSYKQSAYRFIFSILFVHLGYLSQPFNKNRQALHDMVAGSVVVSIDPKKERFHGSAGVWVVSLIIALLWLLINGVLINILFPFMD